MEIHTAELKVAPGATEGLQESLWDIADICTYLKRSKGYVYALVNSPEFPSAVTRGARYRRWIPADVRNYLNGQSSVIAVGRIARVIPINYEPHCSQAS